jgi:hypothetical protein
MQLIHVAATVAQGWWIGSFAPAQGGNFRFETTCLYSILTFFCTPKEPRPVLTGRARRSQSFKEPKPDLSG